MSTNTAPSAKIASQSRLRKVAKRIFRILVIAYALALVLMYFFQTYLIFPGTFRQGHADTQVTAGPGETLLHLKTPDGTPLAALFGEAGAPRLQSAASQPDPPKTTHPAVLLFYGNGDAMTSAQDLAQQIFRPMGYHCMLIDYPGYGMSGGKPSEQGCYDAAEAAYQYLLTRPDVDRTRLIAAGWSLGGGVAINLVHRHRDEHTFCGLVTFCTFTSIADVGRAHYPFLPVGLLVKHRFLSAEKIHDLALPYFNAHGKRDNIIPFAQSDALIAAYGGKPENVTRYICESASHNDFFDHDTNELYGNLENFLALVTK